MRKLLLPIDVTPPPCTVPRLTVTYSRKILSSPMTTLVGSPLYPKCCGGPPIDTNGCSSHRSPDVRPAFNRDMREQPRPVSDRHMFADDTKWSNHDIIGELCLRMDNGMWMNLHAEPPVHFTCCTHSRDTGIHFASFSSVTMAVTSASHTSSESTKALPCIFQNGGRFFTTSIFESQLIPRHDRLAELRPVDTGQIHDRLATVLTI